MSEKSEEDPLNPRGLESSRPDEGASGINLVEQVEELIRLNKGTLSREILGFLSGNQLTIAHWGHTYTFTGTQKENAYKAYFVDPDGTTTTGEFIVNKSETDAYFIPDIIRDCKGTLHVDVVKRAFYDQDQLCELERQFFLTGRYDNGGANILIEDLNAVDYESMRDVVESRDTAESYLEKLLERSTMGYSRRIARVFLERLRSSQAWFTAGHGVTAPLFTNKSSFKDGELAVLEEAEREHNESYNLFKNIELREVSFEKYTTLARDYIQKALHFGRLRMREYFSGIAEEILKNKTNLQLGSTQNVAILVSASFSAIFDELKALFRNGGVQVELQDLDKILLAQTLGINAEDIPNDPMKEARRKIMLGEIDEDSLDLLLAQAAVCQIMKEGNGEMKLKTELGAMERDYMARLEVQDMDISTCQQKYEQLRSNLT